MTTMPLHTLKAEEERDALKAENERLREAGIDALSSLVATISILERTPSARKAVASDKMFAQMMLDYQASADRTRAALEEKP